MMWWNCDLRVINARKKTFSVVPKASPWCPNHVTVCLLRHSGESLQNGQLELRRWNWYFAWETHKTIAVSVWACQAGFWKSTRTSRQLRSKPHVVFHGVCEIALTEVLATQMGMMQRSKKVSSFELYEFNPLSVHSGSTAWELMQFIPGIVWELLQFAATQLASIVNFFCWPHIYTVYWRI